MHTAPPLKMAPSSAGKTLIARYWGWSLGITTGLLLLYRTHPYYVGLLGNPSLPPSQAPVQWCLLAIYAAYALAILSAPLRGDVSSSKTLLAADFLENLPARLRLCWWGTQHAPGPYKPIDAETRTAILSIVVKAFFLPLMLKFFFEHLGGIAQVVQRWPLPTGFSPIVAANFGLDLLYQAIFLVDTSIFAFGYAVEWDRLRNRIISVEPTLFGWAVTLACYPPFNSTTSVFLPDTGTSSIISHSGILLAMRGGAVAFYLIYVWASVALGARASNLTHRGIVSWGPYAIVRHPAYISKNLAWWLEKLPVMSSPVNVLALLAFNLIYALRALTEERHLSMDPDYVAYCERVRYRFIPGVF